MSRKSKRTKSPLDDLNLICQAKADDREAKEALLRRAIPLLVSTARQYRIDGLESRDLIQEGFIGVLQALDRFDPDRGTPFSAFAIIWIRHALQELRSDFVRPMRLPPKALAQLAKLKETRRSTYIKEHREAPIEELAKRCKIPLSQAFVLLRADAPVHSLTEPSGSEEGLLFAVLPDPRGNEDYDRALDQIAGEQVKVLLNKLPLRERSVIEARFGVGRDVPETLEEIGKDLSITPERVRQLENIALDKLRLQAGAI